MTVHNKSKAYERVVYEKSPYQATTNLDESTNLLSKNSKLYRVNKTELHIVLTTRRA